MYRSRKSPRQASIRSAHRDRPPSLRYVYPASVGEIQRTYRLTAGQLVLDLSALDLGGRTVLIDATVAVGRISLLAPEGAFTEVRAHAGAGEVSLLGLSESGLRVDVARAFPAPSPSPIAGPPATRGAGGGTLVLNLKTGVGQIWVNRVVVGAQQPDTGGS